MQWNITLKGRTRLKLKRLDNQNKEQLSMIEVAYEILNETNQMYEFNDLLVNIQEYLGLPGVSLESRMSIFYTELNSDGRFISLGENRWGLRDWYPIDSVDEEIISSIDDEEIRSKHKIKNKKTNVFAASADDDMIDYSDDDPEDHELLEEDFDEVDVEEEEEEDDAEEETKDKELRVYASDLEKLGDDEPEDELEDGIEGDLTVIDDDDLEEEEDF